jgi:hypothetical protein
MSGEPDEPVAFKDELVDVAYTVRDASEQGIRKVVGINPTTSLRRVLLYAAVIVCILAGVALLALLPLFLLAITDTYE